MRLSQFKTELTTIVEIKFQFFDIITFENSLSSQNHHIATTVNAERYRIIIIVFLWHQLDDFRSPGM